MNIAAMRTPQEKETRLLHFRHEDALGEALVGTMRAGRIVGLDEVGYGAWAGPIGVAAVWINRDQAPQDFLNQLDDSKRLTSKKRQAIHDIFVANPHWGACAIEWIAVEAIIQGLVLRATLDAMVQAARQVPDVGGLLVDGRHALDTDLPQKSIPRGDRQSYSVALASIMAKVVRDRLMDQLSLDYPSFGWQDNKGYGTQTHQKAIRDCGLTPHHRIFYCRRVGVSGQ